MSIARAYSAQLTGLQAETVTIEVDISNGLHSFSIVGLGDRAVDEARDRISAAIKNTGFTSPKQKNQKVIISLAPANARKEGPSFDVAMALAYLSAAGDIELDADRKIFLGELSLDGTIRKVSGLLPILCQAVVHGFTTAFIPKDNEKEASLAQGIIIYAVSSIREIIEHIMRREPLSPLQPQVVTGSPSLEKQLDDMSSIRGNETAKRGLEIAAAGAHNIIMCGPPGTGKTMLAHSFRSILPDLSYEHSVEVTGIHSVARILGDSLITRPPFRAPHHTASYPSIVGGGSFPKPGEITLAHRGVLFLDEFPEFDRDVIEALRQPLEDRIITISRARGCVTFPAQCMLIASMNPCPCGLGKDRGCTCPERVYQAYRRRLSGPIMDRIDIWVTVAKIDYDKLSEKHSTSEHSDVIRGRIIRARLRQKERFLKHAISIDYNSEMGPQDIEKCVNLDNGVRELLKASAERLSISGRAFHRAIKVAQTIADLAGEDSIKKEHMLEALQYREKN
jgi:magnesium chelatase family protein